MTKLINAWWLVRLRLRPVGHVLWGGRVDLDLWIGSPEDARRQRWLRIVAARRLAMQRLNQGMVAITLSFQDAMTPVIREAERQLRLIGRTYTESLARQASPMARERLGLGGPRG